MADAKDYRALLAQIAPDLDARELRQMRGQFNDVVMVNGAWVFRFPRSAAAASVLQREVATLRALAGRLSTPIPAPTYSSDDPELPYMGYPALPGEPLSRATLDALSDAQLTAVARQLANFLSELHSLPITLLPAESEVSDTQAYWAQMFEGFRTQLFAHMRPDAREQVNRDFTAFFADPASAAWTPAIRHGDLGGDNILYEAGANRITAVIDFASAGSGDPAIDLASLSTLGERMLARLLEVWDAAPSLLGRARFYRSTFALQEAYYGLRDGDMESFESGIARYR